MGLLPMIVVSAGAFACVPAVYCAIISTSSQPARKGLRPHLHRRQAPALRAKSREGRDSQRLTPVASAILAADLAVKRFEGVVPRCRIALRIENPRSHALRKRRRLKGSDDFQEARIFAQRVPYWVKAKIAVSWTRRNFREDFQLIDG